MPRLDRQRAALARLATATDDAALAGWARLRLRASDFAAAHATPTPTAIATAAARDAADEPLDLAPPPPLSHATGATLVDVAAKLPTLDRLAAINAPRHDEQADVRRMVEEMREAIGTDYFLADELPVGRAVSNEERLENVAWSALIKSTVLLWFIGTVTVLCLNTTRLTFASAFPLASLALLMLVGFGARLFGRFRRWPHRIKRRCVRLGLFLTR